MSYSGPTPNPTSRPTPKPEQPRGPIPFRPADPGKGREDWFYGRLYQAEVDLAKLVYGDTLPYSLIYITNRPIGTTPVTIASHPRRSQATFHLFWPNAWARGVNLANVNEHMRATFIHELCHVWQGLYAGFAMAYMANSIMSQATTGVGDIFRNGPGGAIENLERMRDEGIANRWNVHRAGTYVFTMNDIGRNWNTFNVEQQAAIVESWYSSEQTNLAGGVAVPPGYRSPKDPRFPYIKDVICARNNNASYWSIINQAGYSAEISQIQAKLRVLGYIRHDEYVDGYMGDVTRTAVIEFQRRNGLSPDGDIGTANSDTRRKLNQPMNSLKRKS